MYLEGRSLLCVGMTPEIAAHASRQGSHPVVLIGFMLLLAALDFAGTMLAKEWTIHRAPWQLVAGGATFVALFVVLALGLRYAEMSIVTLGWIVVLQAAVLVVDRSRYGTTITPGGWVAIVLMIVLQGYIVLGATASAGVIANVPEAGQPSAASAAS